MRVNCALSAHPQEIGILKSISYDRNIVQFYGATMVGTEPMLLLEYCEGGDLRCAQQFVPVELRVRVAWQWNGCFGMSVVMCLEECQGASSNGRRGSSPRGDVAGASIRWCILGDQKVPGNIQF
jgi:hypothetical protein